MFTLHLLNRDKIMNISHWCETVRFIKPLAKKWAASVLINKMQQFTARVPN